MTWTRWPGIACDLCGLTVAAGGAALLGRVARCAACLLTPDPREAVADLGLPAELYDFQRLGVTWLARCRAALLADDVGLGKTAQALAALAVREAPCAVVVCPPSVRRQWARAVGRWAPAYRVTVREERGWLRPRQAEVVVCGYPGLRGVSGVTVPEGAVLILDEAQAIKNPDAQQTRGVRTVAERVLAAGGAVWELTATPAYAHSGEAWEVLAAAELHRALHPDKKTWKGLSAAEQAERLARVMLRRRAMDVLDLPPVRYERIEVALSDRIKTAIEAAAREAAGRHELRKTGRDAPTEDEARAAGAAMPQAAVEQAVRELAQGGDLALATTRRLVSVAKLERAVELAQEHEEARQPVVVFADHREPLLRLAERPGWEAVLGGQTPRERDRVVQAFRGGGLSGLAVGYQAGATGVDGLQEASSRAVFLELTWTPAHVEQAIGRLVRHGQTGVSVLVTLLVADHWVDRVVTDCAAEKIKALSDLGVGLTLAGGLA